MNEIAIRSSVPAVIIGELVEAPEVLIGELVCDGVIHDLCGEDHMFAVDGSDLIICCGCGHAHRVYESCLADRSCGSFLCCH